MFGFIYSISRLVSSHFHNTAAENTRLIRESRLSRLKQSSNLERSKHSLNKASGAPSSRVLKKHKKDKIQHQSSRVLKKATTKETPQKKGYRQQGRIPAFISPPERPSVSYTRRSLPEEEEDDEVLEAQVLEDSSQALFTDDSDTYTSSDCEMGRPIGTTKRQASKDRLREQLEQSRRQASQLQDLLDEQTAKLQDIPKLSKAKEDLESELRETKAKLQTALCRLEAQQQANANLAKTGGQITLEEHQKALQEVQELKKEAEDIRTQYDDGLKDYQKMEEELGRLREENKKNKGYVLRFLVLFNRKIHSPERSFCHSGLESDDLESGNRAITPWAPESEDILHELIEKSGPTDWENGGSMTTWTPIQLYIALVQLRKHYREVRKNNKAKFKEHEATITDLEGQIKDLKKQLQARPKGKPAQVEMNKDVQKKVRLAIKEVVFKQMKFVNNRDDDEVKAFFDLIYTVMLEDAGVLPHEERELEDLSRDELFQVYGGDCQRYASTLRSTLATKIGQLVYGASSTTTHVCVFFALTYALFIPT